MTSTRSELVAIAFRLIGRVLALLLILFWGAFFLEHLSEWFWRPKGGYPPPWVWVVQFFHLGIIAGLLLMLRWDRLGVVVTALATVAFFALAGFPGFPTIALINLPPIACLCIAWWLRSRRGKVTSAAAADN